ncbi:MAG: hypothetical protein DRP55_06575 [Spirochaetes bacterium]|nr:dual specificity protein phosphatase family protein [Deltaproteobacteria bacterium]RKX99886.1 MAG: hypothetical protein DRP55_06575 [Spirochaetota bacterium]
MNGDKDLSLRWLIPEKIAASHLPSEEDLKEWKRLGINSIVNLLDGWHGKTVAKWERFYGFKVLHVEIEDMSVPTFDELLYIVRWIKSEIEAKRKIIVHCYAGIGRTGTILTAYLLLNGKSLNQALNMVKKIGSLPQSFSQLKMLESLEKMIIEGKVEL